MKTLAFLLVLTLSLVWALGTPCAPRQNEDKTAAAAKSAELQVLDRLVGWWDNVTIDKTPKLTPLAAQQQFGTNRVEWVLGGKFVLDAGQNTDGSEHLGLWTYDAQAKAYRAWFFFPGSTMELRGQWDAATKTLNTEADLGGGVTSVGKHRFPDKDSYEWTIVATDKSGKVYYDLKGTHARRTPDQAPPKVKAQPQPAFSAELRVLSRWLGNWKSQTTQRPAAWTPKEVRSTGTTTAKWAVNSTFLHDSGGEHRDPYYLSLATYDPTQKSYRNWYFSALGFASEGSGYGDANTKTMTWYSKAQAGIQAVDAVRWITKDQAEWQSVTKDAAGTVYLDSRGVLDRQK